MNYFTLANKSTIKSEYLKDEIYNFLDTTFVMPDEFDFEIVRVSKEYIARPDLISIAAYGDSDFTDIICKINGISNPFELNEGDILVIPSYDYISYFNNNPSAEDREASVENNIPKSKSKIEKRKANESIIGDKRFHIDPSRRVIIY